MDDEVKNNESGIMPITDILPDPGYGEPNEKAIKGDVIYTTDYSTVSGRRYRLKYSVDNGTLYCYFSVQAEAESNSMVGPFSVPSTFWGEGYHEPDSHLSVDMVDFTVKTNLSSSDNILMYDDYGAAIGDYMDVELFHIDNFISTANLYSGVYFSGKCSCSIQPMYSYNGSHELTDPFFDMYDIPIDFTYPVVGGGVDPMTLDYKEMTTNRLELSASSYYPSEGDTITIKWKFGIPKAKPFTKLETTFQVGKEYNIFGSGSTPIYELTCTSNPDWSVSSSGYTIERTLNADKTTTVKIVFKDSILSNIDFYNQEYELTISGNVGTVFPEKAPCIVPQNRKGYVYMTSVYNNGKKEYTVEDDDVYRFEAKPVLGSRYLTIYISAGWSVPRGTEVMVLKDGYNLKADVFLGEDVDDYELAFLPTEAGDYKVRIKASPKYYFEDTEKPDVYEETITGFDGTSYESVYAYPRPYPTKDRYVNPGSNTQINGQLGIELVDYETFQTIVDGTEKCNFIGKVRLFNAGSNDIEVSDYSFGFSFGGDYITSGSGNSGLSGVYGPGETIHEWFGVSTATEFSTPPSVTGNVKFTNTANITSKFDIPFDFTSPNFIKLRCDNVDGCFRSVDSSLQFRIEFSIEETQPVIPPYNVHYRLYVKTTNTDESWNLGSVSGNIYPDVKMDSGVIDRTGVNGLNLSMDYEIIGSTDEQLFGEGDIPCYKNFYITYEIQVYGTEDYRKQERYSFNYYGDIIEGKITQRLISEDAMSFDEAPKPMDLVDVDGNTLVKVSLAPKYKTDAKVSDPIETEVTFTKKSGVDLTGYSFAYTKYRTWDGNGYDGFEYFEFPEAFISGSQTTYTETLDIYYETSFHSIKGETINDTPDIYVRNLNNIIPQVIYDGAMKKFQLETEFIGPIVKFAEISVPNQLYKVTAKNEAIINSGASEILSSHLKESGHYSITNNLKIQSFTGKHYTMNTDKFAFFVNKVGTYKITTQKRLSCDNTMDAEIVDYNKLWEKIKTEPYDAELTFTLKKGSNTANDYFVVTSDSSSRNNQVKVSELADWGLEVPFTGALLSTDNKSMWYDKAFTISISSEDYIDYIRITDPDGEYVDASSKIDLVKTSDITVGEDVEEVVVVADGLKCNGETISSQDLGLSLAYMAYNGSLEIDYLYPQLIDENDSTNYPIVQRTNHPQEDMGIIPPDFVVNGMYFRAKGSMTEKTLFYRDTMDDSETFEFYIRDKDFTESSYDSWLQLGEEPFQITSLHDTIYQPTVITQNEVEFVANIQKLSVVAKTNVESGTNFKRFVTLDDYFGTTSKCYDSAGTLGYKEGTFDNENTSNYKYIIPVDQQNLEEFKLEGSSLITYPDGRDEVVTHLVGPVGYQDYNPVKSFTLDGVDFYYNIDSKKLYLVPKMTLEGVYDYPFFGYGILRSIDMNELQMNQTSVIRAKTPQLALEYMKDHIEMGASEYGSTSFDIPETSLVGTYGYTNIVTDTFTVDQLLGHKFNLTTQVFCKALGFPSNNLIETGIDYSFPSYLVQKLQSRLTFRIETENGKVVNYIDKFELDNSSKTEYAKLKAAQSGTCELTFSMKQQKAEDEMCSLTLSDSEIEPGKTFNDVTVDIKDSNYTDVYYSLGIENGFGGKDYFIRDNKENTLITAGYIYDHYSEFIPGYDPSMDYDDKGITEIHSLCLPKGITYLENGSMLGPIIVDNGDYSGVRLLFGFRNKTTGARDALKAVHIPIEYFVDLYESVGSLNSFYTNVPVEVDYKGLEPNTEYDIEVSIDFEGSNGLWSYGTYDFGVLGTIITTNSADSFKISYDLDYDGKSINTKNMIFNIVDAEILQGTMQARLEVSSKSDFSTIKYQKTFDVDINSLGTDVSSPDNAITLSKSDLGMNYVRIVWLLSESEAYSDVEDIYSDIKSFEILPDPNIKSFTAKLNADNQIEVKIIEKSGRTDLKYYAEVSRTMDFAEVEEVEIENNTVALLPQNEPGTTWYIRGKAVTPYDEVFYAQVPIYSEGANLYDVNSDSEKRDVNTINEDGSVTTTIPEGSTANTYNGQIRVKPMDVLPDGDYALIIEVIENTFTGGRFQPNVNDDNNESKTTQFNPATNYDLPSGLEAGTIYKQIIHTKSDITLQNYGLWTQFYLPSGTTGKMTYRLSVLEDTNISTEDFVYKKYTGPDSYEEISYAITIPYEIDEEYATNANAKIQASAVQLNNQATFTYTWNEIETNLHHTTYDLTIKTDNFPISPFEYTDVQTGLSEVYDGRKPGEKVSFTLIVRCYNSYNEEVRNFEITSNEIELVAVELEDINFLGKTEITYHSIQWLLESIDKNNNYLVNMLVELKDGDEVVQSEFIGDEEPTINSADIDAFEDILIDNLQPKHTYTLTVRLTGMNPLTGELHTVEDVKELTTKEFIVHAVENPKLTFNYKAGTVPTTRSDFTLTWEPPVDSDAEPVDYVIEYKLNEDEWQRVVVTDLQCLLLHTDVNQKNNDKITFRIGARYHDYFNNDVIVWNELVPISLLDTNYYYYKTIYPDTEQPDRKIYKLVEGEENEKLVLDVYLDE